MFDSVTVPGKAFQSLINLIENPFLNQRCNLLTSKHTQCPLVFVTFLYLNLSPTAELAVKHF